MNRIRTTFSTPILVKDWEGVEETNEALKSEILQRAQETQSARNRNIGSWDSGKDFLQWPLEAVETVRKMIYSCVSEVTERVTNGRYKPAREDVRAHAWANVSCEAGSYRKPHNHKACTWSGVYYPTVDLVCEKSKTSGFIEFVDPRAICSPVELPGSSFGRKVSIKPQAGRMVIFPGWLNHYVNPVESGCLRICIAFNVSLEPEAVRLRRRSMRPL
jgi:uncharacterized protein (TIGR02466 family)